MTDPLKPSASLLSKLGSIAIHAQELGENKGHAFDLAAIQVLIIDPEVNEWLEEMRKLALVPVKR